MPRQPHVADLAASLDDYAAAKADADRHTASLKQLLLQHLQGSPDPQAQHAAALLRTEASPTLAVIALVCRHTGVSFEKLLIEAALVVAEA